ncbi:helix-turn-helix domain-containing protein [Nocardia sp. IFM 10818]
MQDAQQSVVRLGQLIRQRRESLGLKPRELADRTSKTLSALEKVENGTRSPGLEYLTEIFDALGVALNYRNFLIDGLFPGLLGRLYGPSQKPVTPQEQAYLDCIKVPSAYVYLPSGDVVATNADWRRTFPRLEPGSNLIEWAFTDPVAKLVFPDWKTVVHGFVFGLKWLAPSAISPTRIEEIRAKCSEADPLFDTMWSTNIVDPMSPVAQARIRNVVRGSIETYAITACNQAFPDRRHWMVYSLVPAVDGPAASAA